jgi:glutathione peroxidase
LVVLGFPSHDFYQEPAPESEIKDFCKLTYDVNFPMFTKTSVRGKKAHPFFKLLAEETRSSPKWNFHKYLIAQDGSVVDSFSTVTGPGNNRIVKKIEELLNKSN